MGKRKGILRERKNLNLLDMASYANADLNMYCLVLNGICRSYYVDGDGNDITHGFSVTGTFCMDEGLFGYSESIVTWETLEETTLMFFDI